MELATKQKALPHISRRKGGVQLKVAEQIYMCVLHTPGVWWMVINSYCMTESDRLLCHHIAEDPFNCSEARGRQWYTPNRGVQLPQVRHDQTNVKRTQAV